MMVQVYYNMLSITFALEMTGSYRLARILFIAHLDSNRAYFGFYVKMHTTMDTPEL